MPTNQVTNSPEPTLTPEAVVDQLRAMRTQIGEVTPLTPAQRSALRSRANTSNPVLQASINVHRRGRQCLAGDRPAGRRRTPVVRRGQPLDGGGG